MSNIYLIKSTSYNILNDKLSAILDNIEEVNTFSLSEVTLDDVLEDSGYFGLFGGKRAIIVKDTKYFGNQGEYADDTKKLENFFNNFPEDLIIIFICTDINKSKRITKSVIEHGGEIIEILPMQEQDLLANLKIYCQNNKININDKTLYTIINNTGGVYDSKKNPTGSNYDIIIKELEKLSLYDNGNITDEIVKLCSIKLEQDVTFDFSNAVIAKNFNQAFTLLDDLLKQNVEPFVIVGVLASAYASIYGVLDAAKHGLSDDEITSTFGYSPYRTTILKRNGRIYTLDELGEIIHNLYELDKKIKTGYNPVYGLKEFLLSL